MRKKLDGKGAGVLIRWGFAQNLLRLGIAPNTLDIVASEILFGTY